MGIEVIYPNSMEQHETKGEYFIINALGERVQELPEGKSERYYIFTCPTCGYKRKVWLEPRKEREILCKGNYNASHYGSAGVGELMDIPKQLRTAMNDGAAKLLMDQDGIKVPVSFG